MSGETAQQRGESTDTAEYDRPPREVALDTATGSDETPATVEAVAAADGPARVRLSCGPGVALETDADQGQTLGADLAVAARWAQFAPGDDPSGRYRYDARRCAVNYQGATLGGHVAGAPGAVRLETLREGDVALTARYGGDDETTAEVYVELKRDEAEALALDLLATVARARESDEGEQ